MDKELLYNQSGIKDITAYKAITNIEGEGKNVNGYEINKGEIWEVESGVGTKLVVVLNCYDKYAATVMLQEQEPSSNVVDIVGHGMMYADAGRLGYVFYDKMVDYVRTLTPEEDKALRQAIGAALDLEVNKVSAATTAAALEARDKAYEEVAAVQKEVDYLREELTRAKEVVQKQAEKATYTEVKPCISVEEIAEIHFFREELAAASKEAEIYKRLYEQLLARALG